MKLSRVRGATSNIFDLFLQDSSSTTGAGKTGLSSSSAGLVVAVKRELASTYTVYAQASSNIESITTIGTFAAPTASKCRFKEIDATNAPGMYQLMLADALFDAGDASRWITGLVFGASGLAPVPFEIALDAINRQDAVRMGLTALPNAAAEASGGLPTLSAAQASNGTIQANVHRWLTATPNALQAGRVDTYLGAVAAGVIAAASFAANALDAVWSTATRILTAGTNIVLAKGTGLTGLNDLDAAGVRGAVGLASANLDTQLAALDSDVTTGTADVLAAIAALNNLSAAQVNAEMVDVLTVDTYAEPSGVPPATTTLERKLGQLYMTLRNGFTVDATDKRFRDDGGSDAWRKPLSDDGTTYTEAEGTAP